MLYQFCLTETSDSDADSDEDEKTLSVEDGPDPFEVSTTTDFPHLNNEHNQDLCTQGFQCETNFEKQEENLEDESKVEKYWPIREGRGVQKNPLQQPHIIFTQNPMEQQCLNPLSTSNNFFIHPNPFYLGRNLSSLMSEGRTLDTARPLLSSQGRHVTSELPIYVQQPSFSSPQVNILNH